MQSLHLLQWQREMQEVQEMQEIIQSGRVAAT
jgi:hypothetical protein